MFTTWSGFKLMAGNVPTKTQQPHFHISCQVCQLRCPILKEFYLLNSQSPSCLLPSLSCSHLTLKEIYLHGSSSGTADCCYSLLRNRKTLRTLESGHFNLRPVNTNGGFTEGGCEHDIKTRPFCVVIVCVR